MASSYYDSAGKTVVDGDVAYAADLNDVNTAVDTAFQQVETDVDTIAANQPFYTNLAQKWAEEVENTPVETGKFSALHWAAKAEDQAILADADRVQTNADRVQTGLDRVQTVADRVQTGLDRTQTGLDVADAEAAAVISVSNARGRNYITDGNFDIWLEATSQTTSGYGSDTLCKNEHNGSTKTHSRQEFSLGQTLVPGNPKYFSRTVVTSVANTSNFVNKRLSVEGVHNLSGGKATLSFWAKADAVKNIAICFLQSFGTGGTPSANVSGIAAQLIALTTVWQKYVITVDIPSIAGKVLGTAGNDYTRLDFWFDAGAIYTTAASLGQQSGTFDLAQVQLEKGEIATEFERMSPGDVLENVNRYYWQGYLVDAYLRYGGTAGANSFIAGAFSFPVQMRAIPSKSIITNPTYSNCSTPVLVGKQNGITVLVTVTAVGTYYALDGVYAADARL